MAAQPRIRYCRCDSKSSPILVDGVWLCSECDEVVPDRLTLAVFREQRKIGQLLTEFLDASTGSSGAVTSSPSTGPTAVAPPS